MSNEGKKMSEKSEAKINMEKAILEAVYWMGIESLDPELFTDLENVILSLHSNRNLGAGVVERLNNEATDAKKDFQKDPF